MHTLESDPGRIGISVEYRRHIGCTPVSHRLHGIIGNIACQVQTVIQLESLVDDSISEATDTGTAFLYGHTHVKLDEVRGGIRCLNPGSVSIPKDGSHSCLIFENGDFRFHIWED